MKKALTLCVVVSDGKILLGMKKRGFGAGRWNGFGGKVEDGETIEAGARRELKEESGLHATHMQKMGVIEFTFQNDPKILEVHIFKVSAWNGEPTESEEMRPMWYDIANIPYSEMWSDDIFWLPLLLQGKFFRGKFLFDQPSTLEYSAKIITQELEEVMELEHSS